MKKILFTASLLLCISSQAQDTYLNNTLVNGTGDLYGTARYVGMGGAMGALGADLSTMSFNPAGIALYRRSDISITAGGLWNQDGTKYGSNATGTFDQAGAVFATRPSGSGTNFVFGFNYQKKINYNSAFDIVGGKLNGLSQMDQLADLVNYGYDTRYNLSGLAFNPYNTYDSYLTLSDDGTHWGNIYSPQEFDADYHFSGSLNSYDLDFAFNRNDRIYFGLDINFENLDFSGYSRYSEFNEPTSSKAVAGNYTLNNDLKISGWGVNFKFGFIARPFAESSFRFGLAVETPTWYRLRNSTLYHLRDEFIGARSDEIESVINYRLTTPWRVRASMGSTIGQYLAWDVDYELANWSGMTQRYDGDYGNKYDHAMNNHMKNNLATMHLVKVGLEGKLSSSFALRVGYNYASAPMSDQATFDQCGIYDEGTKTYSLSRDYATRTSFMRMKPTNIITLGMGYKYKKFYADIAYKLRSQKADFFAFDTAFTSDDSGYFILDNPEMAGSTIDPVEVNKTTHQITATLGFKF